MKWFIRLFLLLGLFLFGESGLHAGLSPLHGNQYLTINHHNLPVANFNTTIHNRQSCNYSSTIRLKREYRKIKGTKEEDENKKSLRQKRVKGLESNAGKYILTRPAEASALNQIINPYSFARKKGTPSSYHFLSAKSYRLYNRFGVFRI